MPINIIEQHPFLNYLETENVKRISDYNGMIIGSFPIYSITDSIDNNFDIVAQRFNQINATMRFFYGSRKSSLWKYIAGALNEVDPTAILQNEQLNQYPNNDKERTIKLLQKHKLIITDSLYRTNRVETKSEDVNLWITENVPNNLVENFSVNFGILNLLNNNKSIQNLYFTATTLVGKSPFGWFNQIFGNNLLIENENIIDGKLWSFTTEIDERTFNVFMLPTPKPRGIHFTDNRKSQMFVNYLENTYPEFYAEIENIPMLQRTPVQKEFLLNSRNSFLIECYHQALVLNNLNFNGNPNI